jgi:hypothetical protein
MYACKGSRRPNVKHQREQRVEPDTDLVNMAHFNQALTETIFDMKQKEQEKIQQASAHRAAREREEKKRKMKRDQGVDVEEYDRVVAPELMKRQNDLVQKITSIFKKRDVTFFDIFSDIYDSLSSDNIISINEFKKRIHMLNLRLTV